MQTLLNRLQMGGDQMDIPDAAARLGPTMRSTSSPRAIGVSTGMSRCGADAAEDVEAARTWQHHAQHGRQVRPASSENSRAQVLLPLAPGALGFS